jgi:hypothetical protein
MGFPFQPLLPGAAQLQSGGAITHAATGALVGQGAAVDGSSNRFRAHPATGVLTGQGSAVDGSADRTAAPVTHAATGVLSGQGSIVDGAAARFRALSATGAIVGPGADVSGSASRFRAFYATGDLSGQGALIDGSADRSGSAATHDASGVLAGQGAVITGSADHTAPTGSQIPYGSGDDEKKRKGKTYLDLIYEAEDAALKARNSAIKPVEQPKPIETKPAEVITVDESKALAYYESLRQQEQALIAAQIEAELRTLAYLEAERLRRMQDDEDVFLLLAACGYTVKH